MADFLPMTSSKLNLNPGFTGTANVASNGPANSGLPKASHTVGAHGDNADNSGGGTQMVKCTTKVGATGDNAAKRGD